MPFVAVGGGLVGGRWTAGGVGKCQLAFDAEGGDTLVYCVESIFWDELDGAGRMFAVKYTYLNELPATCRLAPLLPSQ